MGTRGNQDPVVTQGNQGLADTRAFPASAVTQGNQGIQESQVSVGTQVLGPLVIRVGGNQDIRVFQDSAGTQENLVIPDKENRGILEN